MSNRGKRGRLSVVRIMTENCVILTTLLLFLRGEKCLFQYMATIVSTNLVFHSPMMRPGGPPYDPTYYTSGRIGKHNGN